MMTRRKTLQIGLLLLSTMALVVLTSDGAETDTNRTYSLKFVLDRSEDLDTDGQPGELCSRLELAARRLGVDRGIRCRGPLGGELKLQLRQKEGESNALPRVTVVPFEDGATVRATTVLLDGGEGDRSAVMFPLPWRVSGTDLSPMPSSYRGVEIPLRYTGQRFDDTGIPEGVYQVTFRLRAQLAFNKGSNELLECTSTPCAFFVRSGGEDYRHFQSWSRHLWRCARYNMAPRSEILEQVRKVVAAARKCDVRLEFGFIDTVYQACASEDERYRLYCEEYRRSPETFGPLFLRERKTFRQLSGARKEECPLDPPLAYPFEVEEQFLRAYREKSVEALVQLFDTWHCRVIPMPPELLARESQLTRDVYAIFREFYTPFSLDRIGKGLSDASRGAKFVIVQDYVDVVVQRDGKTIRSSTIRDFRPNLQNMPARPLLAARACQELVVNFLDNMRITEDVAGEVKMADEREKMAAQRWEFLNKVVRILPGHWGGFHVATHPFVSEIDFNESGDRASLHFQVDCYFGEADFAVADGQWKMQKSRITGIE
jgi:hypothetical protein